MSEEQIKKGIDEAFKAAGPNAYFGNGFRAGIKFAENSKWISVKDQLPINEGKVLLCYGEPFFGESTPEIEAGYYDEESGKFLFWINNSEIQGFGVTHWQPLPALPTE
jgi:hypothetical protein